MKQILIGLTTIVVAVAALSGCDAAKDRTTYNGPEYVMFSDTLSYFPVSNSKDYFEVPVGSTVACDYDRTFAVEVDDQHSNVVENKHYVMESNSVTIKAGERAANVRIRGIYENIGKTDSLSLTLRLLAKEDVTWDTYGNKTRIEIMKSCPFDINTFTGYCKVTSTFFRDYIKTDFRLIQTEVAEGEENTIIMHDFFCNGYDIKLKFDPSDPLEPFVEMDDQVLGTTAEVFGTQHGDGKLRASQPTTYTSYYNVCQSFVFQYMTAYVNGVKPSPIVGTYINILEWISDEEAEQLKKEGY